MNQAENKRYWQNWDDGDIAQRIDVYWQRYEQEWRQILTKDIREVFGEQVPMLEVGCGSGLIYQVLKENNVIDPASYTGGDVSQNMLTIAKQRFPEAHFEPLDIFNLHYPDRSQENVICIQVLQHLPGYAKPVRELVRITRKRLYIVAWFIPGDQDEMIFNEASNFLKGPAFFNNNYSLSKFISYLSMLSGVSAEAIRVQPLLGKAFSICVTFI